MADLKEAGFDFQKILMERHHKEEDENKRAHAWVKQPTNEFDEASNSKEVSNDEEPLET